MEIKGKYGTANVFASIVDDETKKQIKNLMNQKFIKDTYVSIMADCHAGKGCVIGTTMKITNNCVPSLVGVDIGCGMITVNLKKMDINLIKLDRFIRKKIPFGNDVRNETIKSNVDITKLYAYNSLKHKDRIEKSLGTFLHHLSIKNYNTCTIFHLVLLKYPTINNNFCYLSTFLVTW